MNLNDVETLQKLVAQPEMADFCNTIVELSINSLPDEYKSSSEYRYWGVRVVNRAEGKFAVSTMFNEQLGKDGTWSHESNPSSRTKKFKKNHRFTLSQAIKLAYEASLEFKLNGISRDSFMKLEDAILYGDEQTKKLGLTELERNIIIIDKLEETENDAAIIRYINSQRNYNEVLKQRETSNE